MILSPQTISCVLSGILHVVHASLVQPIQIYLFILKPSRSSQ